MDPTLRSDRELAEQVQAGESPAFASLVARHAPRVRGRLAAEGDPAAATLRVWVRVLRQLRGGAPDQEVGAWIDTLADDQADLPAPAAPPAPTDDEIDELWHDLQAYWPTGRRRREQPGWVRPVAMVAALVALAVLVPYATMTALRDDRAPEPAETDLVARPFTGELREVPVEPTPEDPDLPAFEFPTFDRSAADPAAGPTPPTAAEPVGGPASEPVASPDPAPAEVTDPDATEEPAGDEGPGDPPGDTSEPSGPVDPAEPPATGSDDVAAGATPVAGEAGAT